MGHPPDRTNAVSKDLSRNNIVAELNDSFNNHPRHSTTIYSSDSETNVGYDFCVNLDLYHS